MCQGGREEQAVTSRQCHPGILCCKVQRKLKVNIYRSLYECECNLRFTLQVTLLIHRFKTSYFICSCKSLEYGLGYSSSGKFANSLYKQGLGQCKLRSVDAPTEDLKSCYYDYYQKKPLVSAGSRGLLSKMALFTMLVLLTLAQRQTPQTLTVVQQGTRNILIL